MQRLKLSDVQCQVFYTVFRKQELSDSDRSDLTLQFFFIELMTQRFNYKTMKKVLCLILKPFDTLRNFGKEILD